MKMENGIQITIKKGYSQRMRDNQKEIIDKTGHYHPLHTLILQKEYVDRDDDVAVLKEVVADIRTLLTSLENQLEHTEKSRKWFKGTDLEF